MNRKILAVEEDRGHDAEPRADDQRRHVPLKAIDACDSTSSGWRSSLVLHHRTVMAESKSGPDIRARS